LHSHDTQIAALQGIHGVIYVPLLYQSPNFYTASGITPITSYTDGMIIDVSLNQTSGSGGVTININSIGTKSLLKYLTAGTTTNLAANDLILNKDYLFRYSFSAGAFIWINPTSGDQTNIAGTSGNFIKINTDNTPIDSGQSQSNFSASGIFAFSGDNLASPNTTTGAQNDVVITGLNVFGWNGAGASSINGFGGGTQGRILYVLNESSTYQLTLNNENTGSASTNRLRTPDQGANIIGPRQSAQLIYDSTDSRWLVQDEGTYRSNPAMNGSVSAGTAGQLPSAGDHVHPTDTSLMTIVVPGTTGNVLTSNGSAWTSAAPAGGGNWTSDANTWTYSSADAPTFVISVNADMTAILTAGCRIKLTQTTVKYFIVTAVGAFSGGATLITVYGGTDYTLANAAITSPNYSYAKAPTGFPLSPAKWTVQVTDSSSRNQSTPTQNVWYNLGTTACQITIPIGIWRVEYFVTLDVATSSTSVVNMYSTLSTGNSTESDTDLTEFVYQAVTIATTGLTTISRVYAAKILSLASKTLYYLNGKTNQTTASVIAFANNTGQMTINAICAYL